MSRNASRAPWHLRRKIILSVLLFDAAIILLSLLRDGIPADVAGVAISSAFASATAVVGSYVFGAVWDDKTARPIQGPENGREGDV